MARRNIFDVDIEAIKEILAEANSPVAHRSRQLLAAFDRVPASLRSDEELKRAVAFSRMMKDQIKECRASRLSDQRSFRSAIKVIDEYFADFEKPLKSALEKLSKIIARSSVAQTSPLPPSVMAVPIVKSEAGVAVAASALTGQAQPAQEAKVSLQWMVASINRQEIDLEALRPYLTETALRQAASRHLQEHGPNQLKGVSFEQAAVI